MEVPQLELAWGSMFNGVVERTASSRPKHRLPGFDGVVGAQFGWVDMLTIKINRSMASENDCAGAVLDVC